MSAMVCIHTTKITVSMWLNWCQRILPFGIEHLLVNLLHLQCVSQNKRPQHQCKNDDVGNDGNSNSRIKYTSLIFSFIVSNLLIHLNVEHSAHIYYSLIRFNLFLLSHKQFYFLLILFLFNGKKAIFFCFMFCFCM